MSDESPLSHRDSCASFKTFLEKVNEQTPTEEPVIVRRLRGAL
jgi:hypothetical protein